MKSCCRNNCLNSDKTYRISKTKSKRGKTKLEEEYYKRGNAIKGDKAIFTNCIADGMV